MFRALGWGRVSAVLLAVFGIASAGLAEPRKPHVAGAFYPESRQELSRVVTELLQRHPVPTTDRKPRILISPHAGYPYSGPIAGAAFRQIQGYTYDGVVVVGFMHRMSFPGASVDAREAYETPLGLIPVDLEAVGFLQTQRGIASREEAHAAEEHSLEVMLPFLQVALGDVKLVPILMGSVSYEDAAALAEALAALAKRGDYLFIFSTDLSHYHPYDEAVRIDERTVGAMLFETPQAVHRLFEGAALEACGRGPILTSLLLSAALGHLKPELVRYANSGDTAGDRSRVVGYAAIAMADQPVTSTTPRLSPDAGQALVQAARTSLTHWFAQRSLPPLPELERFPELSKAQGVFVTLRRDRALRGCIGRIQSDEPLATSVPLVALDSALRDARFAPVTAEELGTLHIEVSVLTPPVRLASLNDLVAGRDGVILELQNHSGVFLPQVWDETGWTREEFLRELASQKAGLPPDAWQRATLYVFQDQIFEELVEGEPLPASGTRH